MANKSQSFTSNVLVYGEIPIRGIEGNFVAQCIYKAGFQAEQEIDSNRNGPGPTKV